MTSSGAYEHDDGFHDFARCPHCGEEDQELSDYPVDLKEDGDSTVMTCSYCGGEFQVVLCVEYTYGTFKTPRISMDSNTVDVPEERK